MNESTRISKDFVAPVQESFEPLYEEVNSRPAPMPGIFELTAFALRVAEVLALVGSAILFAELILDRLSLVRVQYYTNAVIIAAVFYAGLAEVTGVYDVDVRFSLRKAWGRLLTAWLASFMFLITLGFLFKVSEEFSRGWVVAWFFGGAIAVCAARAAVTLWLRQLKRRGVFNQRVAIFGANVQGARFAKYVQGNNKLTIDLVGFFDDRPVARLGERPMNVPIVGNLDRLMDCIRAAQIDQVIVALPWSAEQRLQEVVTALAVSPVQIRLAPDLASFAFAQRPVVLLGDLPVMTLFERPISGFDQLLKKAEDMILGTILTLLAIPLMALIAVAIRLDSPGPVFFRQPREGWNNKPFKIWKFRTMRHEECEQAEIRQATKNDPRVTRVGALLRRTSLDELPQLFNVIQGQMSVVGPRPHAPSTRAGSKSFAEVVSTYAARHNVKPGITGWAQVCGWRGETDTEEKLVKRLEHDLYYIENWSLLFDLYVLIRTGPALLTSKAY